MYPCDPLPARDQRMSKNPASNSYRPTLPLGILFAEIITAPNAQEHVPSLARHGLNPPSCPPYRWARWGRTVQSQNPSEFALLHVHTVSAPLQSLRGRVVFTRRPFRTARLKPDGPIMTGPQMPGASCYGRTAGSGRPGRSACCGTERRACSCMHGTPTRRDTFPSRNRQRRRRAGRE